MDKMIEFIIDCDRKADIAGAILNQLPDWFGLPDSTKKYIEDSRELPFWAYMEENQPKGFIVLKETSPHTAEIYVMGVLKEHHNQNIGTRLFREFEQYAGEKGYEFLQVKTVQKGHYEEYDRTNAFYEHLGFREFECLPTLWDEWNPCQIYIKAVESRKETGT